MTDTDNTLRADEAHIENMIREKGKTALRLTPADIDAAILAEQYYVFPGTTLTVCCLTLKNGFQTVGHSACLSPENFDEEIGRKVAFNKAREEIWGFEGYRLKSAMNAEEPRPTPLASDGNGEHDPEREINPAG